MLKRLLRRVMVLGLGILTVWLIVYVFRFTDRRLPTVLALAITYGIAAYIVLPRIVRMSVKILLRKRVPRFTITGDGLPGDPVNLVLTGTLQQLHAAFKLAGWSETDRLSLAAPGAWSAHLYSSLRIRQPRLAPSIFLGRGQDLGFQKSIDNSPRKRHHVRFWALSSPMLRPIWEKRVSGRIPTVRPTERASTGWQVVRKTWYFFLTRLTFQITHATDLDTNAERDYIINELRKSGVIGEIN